MQRSYLIGAFGWQTTWVFHLCLPLPSYQVLWKSVIAFYLRFIFLLSRSDIHLYIVTYIQTAWQMKYNCRPTKRGYPSRLQSCILTSWSACLLQQFVLLPFIISLEGLLSLDVGAVKHGEIENIHPSRVMSCISCRKNEWKKLINKRDVPYDFQGGGGNLDLPKNENPDFPFWEFFFLFAEIMWNLLFSAKV